MKRIKTVVYIVLVGLTAACSLTVDIDDEDEAGRITAIAQGNNSDGSVSLGGYLDLEVNVFDRDGIASIRVEIPAINVDFLTNIDSHNSAQKIIQSFMVNEIDSNESKTIFVTLSDKDGNRYTNTIAFAIK